MTRPCASRSGRVGTMGEGSVRCRCCRTPTALVLDGDTFICRWCRDQGHEASETCIARRRRLDEDDWDADSLEDIQATFMADVVGWSER